MTQHEQILVVDDEANIRLTLSTLLRRAGYDVYTAENGKEAVALLEQHMFDLLLVDLRLWLDSPNGEAQSSRATIVSGSVSMSMQVWLDGVGGRVTGQRHERSTRVVQYE